VGLRRRPGALTDALAEDPSVDEGKRVHADSRGLALPTVVDHASASGDRAAVASRGAILDARAQEATWTFRLLFPRRDAVAAIVESCDRYGVDARIERIYPMTESSRTGQSDLTEQQLQTVEIALERGYYDVPGRRRSRNWPRNSTSHTRRSPSGCARGHRRLVETTLGARLDRESRPETLPTGRCHSLANSVG